MHKILPGVRDRRQQGDVGERVVGLLALYGSFRLVECIFVDEVEEGRQTLQPAIQADDAVVHHDAIFFSIVNAIAGNPHAVLPCCRGR